MDPMQESSTAAAEEAGDGYAHPIRQLRIRNFKSIRSAEVNLGGLTAIVGANSSGKSSLIQVLRLMSQAADGPSSGALIPLVGQTVRLGSFRDVLSTHATQPRISLGMTYAAPQAPVGRDRDLSRRRPSQAELDLDLELRKPRGRGPSSFAQISRVEFSAKINRLGVRPGFFDIRARPSSDWVTDTDLIRVANGEQRDARLPSSGGALFGSGSMKVEFLRILGGVPCEAYRVAPMWEMVLDMFVTAVKEQPRLFGRRSGETIDHAEPGVGPEDCFKAVIKAMISVTNTYNEKQFEQLSKDWAHTVDDSFRRVLEAVRQLDEELAPLASRGFGLFADELRALFSNTDFDSVTLEDDVHGDGLTALERLPQPVLCPAFGWHDVDLWRASQVYMRPFLAGLRFLGPLRSAPKRSGDVGKDPTDIGFGGEHTFAALHFNGESTVVPPVSNALALGEEPKLSEVVDAWLSYIGVASSVSTDDAVKDGISLTAQREPNGRAFDLSEVGVGVSQVLPVVLACLLTAPGQVVAIEQPELHLHPSMQIRLAEFLLACAKSGRQVIVESHSEYLVNRLRRHAVEEPKSSELVKLVFAEQDAVGVTNFRESTVHSDGSLDDDWPSGFLDVASEEALKLLRAHVNRDPDI